MQRRKVDCIGKTNLIDTVTIIKKKNGKYGIKYKGKIYGNYDYITIDKDVIIRMQGIVFKTTNDIFFNHTLNNIIHDKRSNDENKRKSSRRNKSR